MIKSLRIRALIPGIILGLAVALVVCLRMNDLQDLVFGVAAYTSSDGVTSHAKKSVPISKLRKQIADLEKRLSRFIPTDPYLIVSTSDNMFWLMRGDSLLRWNKCSTGSYTLLKTKDGAQQFTFKTPRGMYRILGKQEDPVWHKPDWAFIEEGKPIPPLGSPDRNEYGVLGAYAMTLGQGYMLHGTLYQRFLGMPVTHGCVRLGDADLEAIYKTVRIGTRVYIY